MRRINAHLLVADDEDLVVLRRREPLHVVLAVHNERLQAVLAEPLFDLGVPVLLESPSSANFMYWKCRNGTLTSVTGHAIMARWMTPDEAPLWYGSWSAVARLVTVQVSEA